MAEQEQAQEVEATTMEVTLSTVVDREVAKAEAIVATWPEKFQPRVPKDEADYRQAKRERSALRRETRDVVDTRKALTKDIKEVTRKVELRFKPAIEQGERMDSEYKAGITKYEQLCADRNLSALGRYYSEIAPAMEEQVPFERINAKWGQADGWHKPSANLAKMQEQLQGHCQEISDTEQRIVALTQGMPEEDTNRWRAEYFRTLDFQEAARIAQDAREQRERLRQLDAEREAREAYERDQRAQAEPYVPEESPLPMEEEPEYEAPETPQTPGPVPQGQAPVDVGNGSQAGAEGDTGTLYERYLVWWPKESHREAMLALKSVPGSHGRKQDEFVG